MVGVPHRGEVGETKEGGALLLDDLCLNVDGCDVWEGKSFVAAVTRVASGDHVLTTVIICGGDG